MLDADAVIHAAGPRWHGGEQQEDQLLASADSHSLQVAEQRGLTSVAFPSISTGSFRFPIKQAARIAIAAVASATAARSTLEEVIFVLFSDADLAIYEDALTAWANAHAVIPSSPYILLATAPRVQAEQGFTSRDAVRYGPSRSLAESVARYAREFYAVHSSPVFGGHRLADSTDPLDWRAAARHWAGHLADVRCAPGVRLA